MSSFQRKCGAASVGEWNVKFGFIKQVDKGRITTVKRFRKLTFRSLAACQSALTKGQRNIQL